MVRSDENAIFHFHNLHFHFHFQCFFIIFDSFIAQVLFPTANLPTIAILGPHAHSEDVCFQIKDN